MKHLRAVLSGVGAFIFLVSLGVSAVVSAVSSVSAATAASATATPKVTFAFDDGLASSYTQAAPTLAKYGLSGTNYVITGCVGMTKSPNTCRANTRLPYMTWTQIKALQNTYGWEIGSHTVDHQCLASNSKVDPSDCQKTTLTTAQVDAELANSKATLAANGINATDFAPPYGDFNTSVLAEIAKYYASMRQFKNAAGNANVWPYSDYYLQDVAVQEGVNTVASIEAQVDQTIANNQWLILTFHDIAPSPSINPDDYQYGTKELDAIAAYVKAKQDAGLIQSVHINQGLVSSSTNLLPNASFDGGIAGGWTTDAPLSITKDAGNHGSYPSPKNAVKIVSGSTSEHLFSPKVSIDPNTTYLLKNFLNVQALTSGEVGFYIDEYDANGNWISGQWKGAERSSFVENMNFTYKPSSANVSQAALQVYVTATPGVTAYLDNTQWFPLATAAAPTNLVANGAFDDGLGDGWRTDDSVNIVADAANHGSPNNPVNSVKVQAATGNTHVFSPLVSVDSTKHYSLSTYVNLTSLTTGEIGFYIDEYDANGNWVSGQYRAGDHTLGANTVNFAYAPSSASVARASLQIIVVGNSGAQAYLDDIRWYAAN